MSVELTEKFLADIAGWQAMKEARAYLETNKVISSAWMPPVLKGVIQAGETSYRSGLVIQHEASIENLCTCRASREWGTICAHSVAIGLHFLRPAAPAKVPGTSPGAASIPVAKVAPKSIRALRREESGEPVEIAVILPPNLPAAIERGKIMLVFEGIWKQGRAPLNALPMSQTFRFSPQDAALLNEIERIADGDTPGMMQVELKDFAALLPKLAEHPRVTLGKTTEFKVSKAHFRFPLRAELDANGEITVRLASEGNAAGGQRILVTSSAGSWMLAGNALQPVALPPAYVALLQGPVRLTRRQVPMFLSQDWPMLQAACDVQANFTLADFSLEPQPPRFILHLAGGLAQLQATLQCAYGARILTPGATSKDEALWLPDEKDAKRYSTRDWAAEQNATAVLTRAGFSAPDTQGRRQLNGQNQVLNFFAREFSRLERAWQVTLEERLQHSANKNFERVEPQFQIAASGIQWFDLGVTFATRDGEKFSQADIQRLLLSGQSHTKLRNGKFAIIDTGAVEELQEVLLDCSPRQSGGQYRIAAAQAGFLESTLQQQGWTAQAPADWRAKARQQSGEAKLVCPPLGKLEEVLRPYQKHGVAWLHFLRQNQFGGILADEMGLGKTLQTLAFLKTLQGTAPRRPHLVICPTSLVFNWVAEAKKFTPDLKVIALHGAQRHPLFAKIAESDLVITSYALIRRDAEKYEAHEFETVILDEAQHIKNRQTQNAQAVKSIRARHRLVLTGTPLENSVLDLWSIFDFLMPGYLGSAQDFRERYELPITREKGGEAQARLARRLRPFILRRLKRDVAKDLPDKLEQVSFCELTDDQRAVYDQLLAASRKEILDAVGTQGLAKSRMLVLTTLLRLRQVCCDLRLLKLEAAAPESGEALTKARVENSGKLDLFSELLDEIVDGGHRVLVFSQFTSMLGLLREKLDEEKVAYCYLDGSTHNRGEVVQKFQGDAGIPVFLISLKAGGVGLNLTGADTVVHFDPWWNPAVEDQATGRAHRIGQTRVVTSYKLITRDTVEEKILLLQQRKREIIAATLSGEEQLLEKLSWEEIQELLR